MGDDQIHSSSLYTHLETVSSSSSLTFLDFQHGGELPVNTIPKEPPEKRVIRQLSEKLQIELNALYHELREDIDVEFKAQRRLLVRAFSFSVYYHFVLVVGHCPLSCHPLHPL